MIEEKLNEILTLFRKTAKKWQYQELVRPLSGNVQQRIVANLIHTCQDLPATICMGCQETKLPLLTSAGGAGLDDFKFIIEAHENIVAIAEEMHRLNQLLDHIKILCENESPNLDAIIAITKKASHNEKTRKATGNRFSRLSSKQGSDV